MTDLPVLGAALMIADLERFMPFLHEAPRDLELQDFFKPEVLSGDWQPMVEHARSLLDGHEGRVGIHGPFVNLPLASTDPEIRAVVNKRMHQGLDACEALGGTHMVIHSPYSTWASFHLVAGEAKEADLIAACHDTIGDVVKRAASIGCTLVVENIEDIDPFSRLRLIDSFDSEALALSIDTGHAHYAHGRTGAPPVDYFIRAAGNRLAHVHLQDADGYADRHWALGEGNILWPSVFAALAELDSQPRLIIELAEVDGIPASVAHLTALGLAR